MNKFQSIYRAFGSTVRSALHFDGGTSGSYDPNGQMPGNNYYGNSPAPVQPTESKAFSIVSLVTGILSVLIGCCCNPYIAIILGVVAIVFAALSKKKNGKFGGLAVAGLVCGIVGTAFGVLSIIIAQTEFYQKYLEEVKSYLESLGFDINEGASDPFESEK